MCEKNSKTRTCPSQAKKYPHMPKISPGGLPVSSINSEHINIYTQGFIQDFWLGGGGNPRFPPPLYEFTMKP